MHAHIALKIGDKLPDFNLPGVDGKDYSPGSFALNQILIVMFTCNHCPYVVAYEDRLIKIQFDYKDKGVSFVAINSNDEKNYPEDSFESMVKRAKEKGFNFPYLRDKTQEVARLFGAVRTPEIFLFDKDRDLRYHGEIDDNWRESNKVTRHTLRNAIDFLLSGKELSDPETHAIGCTVKWSS